MTTGNAEGFVPEGHAAVYTTNKVDRAAGRDVPGSTPLRAAEEELAATIELLDEVAARLIQRVSPVLLPTEPREVPEASLQAIASDLGATLIRWNARLRNLGRVLDETADRVDL